MFLLNFGLIVLYLTLYGLARITGAEVLKILPGLLIIYYLPGHNLNSVIFNFTARKVGWFARTGLDVAGSIAVIYLVYSRLGAIISYDRFKAFELVLLLNIFLFGLNLAVTFFKDRTAILKLPRLSKLTPETRQAIIIASLPAFLFSLRILLNPYVFELDSSQYFHIFNDILVKGYDTSWLTGQRNAFALFMIYSHYIAGLSFIGFIKFFTPLLFFFTTLPLLDLSLKIRHKPLAYLAYLLILSSPLLTIGNEGVRPETFIFVLTVPVLYLLHLGIKQSVPGYAFMAMVIAYVSFRFHELGLFLVLSSLVGFLPLLKTIYLSLNKFARAQPTYFFIFLVLVAVLTRGPIQTLLGTFKSGIFGQLFSTLPTLYEHLTWQWWFLDSFVNVDGGATGWPGREFIYYYLYHGVGALAVLGVLAFYLIRGSRSPRSLLRRLIPTVLNSPALPVIFLLALYLTIAEILPRIGIFLLPNRTWPHLVIAAVFFSVLSLRKLEEQRAGPIESRIFLALVWTVVVSGIVGSILGTVFMGGQVLPSERKVIAKIRDLPADSVLVSTQVNQNLVEMYGKKLYLPIKQIPFNNQAAFNQEVAGRLDKYPEQVKKDLLSAAKLFYIEKKEFKSGSLTREIILKSTAEEDIDGIISLLKQYDPSEYSYIISKLRDLDGLRDRPVYYIYSFAKLEGVLATRQWWYQDNDPSNRNILENYRGPNIVYRDRYAILIRVR